MKKKKRSNRRYVSPASFNQTRLMAGLSFEETAKALGVSWRTVYNWETGKCRIPFAAFELLQVRYLHTLPGGEFSGWYVQGDHLFDFEGRWYEAGEIRALPYLRGQLKELQREINRLRPPPPPPEPQQLCLALPYVPAWEQHSRKRGL